MKLKRLLLIGVLGVAVAVVAKRLQAGQSAGAAVWHSPDGGPA